MDRPEAISRGPTGQASLEMAELFEYSFSLEEGSPRRSEAETVAPGGGAPIAASHSVGTHS
jgi:hypothetical protein